MNARHPSRQTLALVASGGLAGEERTAAEGHIEECPECAAHWRALTDCCDALRNASAQHREAEPSLGFHARLRAAVSEPAAWPDGRWLVPACAGAAVVLIAAFAWNLKPALDIPQKLAGNSAPTAIAPSKPIPPPTIRVYQRAATESDAALEQLLERHAATLFPTPGETPRAWNAAALAGL